MAKVRPGKWLTQEDKNFFMRLTPKEITKRFLQDIFSDKYNLVTNKKTESRFNTYDQFELKAGEYHSSLPSARVDLIPVRSPMVLILA